MSITLVTAGLIALVVVIAVYLLRRRRLRHLRLEATTPATNRADTSADTMGLDQSPGDSTRDRDLAEAVVAGAFSVPVSAFWEIVRIDGSAIRGISAASAHIDGVPTVASDYHGFLSYVADNGGNLDVPGFQSRLLGYVGEQQAADAFSSQGHLIEMATSSNNPGWDFLLDGHAVNVKTYQDAAKIAHYAAADPGTSFVVPADAAHIPDLSNVAALDGFSYADAHDSLHTSVDAAHSLVSGEFLEGAADVGIPFTAIGFAVYRQVRAVRAGKELRSAVRDGVIDGGSRAAAILAGAKAGLMFVDAPAGGATYGAGTLIGGVGGAVFGAKFSHWLQDRPLRGATGELDRALVAYGEQFRSPDNIAAVADALAAPAERSRTTADELDSACSADRRSLRWWLWPGADQVLREVAAEYGRAAATEQEAAAAREQEAWRELASQEQARQVIGMLMANNPHLAARCNVDLAMLDRVDQARRKADGIRGGRHRG